MRAVKRQTDLHSKRLISENECDSFESLTNGNQRDFDRFIRANRGWMFNVAQRVLKDEASAEDCVQESIIRALAALHGFQGRGRLRSWLRCIVINTALMKLRKQRRLAEVPLDHTSPTFERGDPFHEAHDRVVPTPAEILEQTQLCALIAAKIDLLPETHRTILKMRDLQELTTEEVGAVLGLSKANVRVRLHRARAALKALIEPDLSMSSATRVQARP